jgi:hypothetical protein
MPGPAGGLPLTVERAGEPRRRDAATRSVQDRREAFERDKRKIRQGADPAYDHIGTVVVASAWLAFYVVATVVA